jgi:hypothetical protein
MTRLQEALLDLQSENRHYPAVVIVAQEHGKSTQNWVGLVVQYSADPFDCVTHVVNLENLFNDLEKFINRRLRGRDGKKSIELTPKGVV